MRRILVILAALALVTSMGTSATARTTRQASRTGRATSSDQDERRFLCNEGDPLCAETADAIALAGSRGLAAAGWRRSSEPATADINPTTSTGGAV